MENKNISQITLERIKGEGIKPLSRKIFSIKRVLFWSIVIFSLVIGVLTFSLILSALFNNDWDLYGKLGFNFILRTLPYFWFISLIVFTILGEYYYRKTLLGHRRGFIMILFIYLTLTTVFGSILYAIGAGEIIEKSIESKTPNYRQILFNHFEIWSHPEDGFLSGKIVRVIDGGIEVVDTNGYFWTVNMANTFIRGRVEIEIGERIKIVGQCTKDNICQADEIRPWVGMENNNMILYESQYKIMR